MHPLASSGGLDMGLSKEIKKIKILEYEKTEDQDLLIIKSCRPVQFMQMCKSLTQSIPTQMMQNKTISSHPFLPPLLFLPLHLQRHQHNWHHTDYLPKPSICGR